MDVYEAIEYQKKIRKKQWYVMEKCNIAYCVRSILLSIRRFYEFLMFPLFPLCSWIILIVVVLLIVVLFATGILP